MRLTRRRTSKAISAFCAGVIVCSGVISVVAAVNYFLLQSTQLCVFRAVTGLPCPGCGLTHAGLAFLRGEVIESLRYHALLIPYILTIAANSIRIDFWVVNWLCSQRWIWTILIGSLAYYAVRIAMFFPDGPYPMIYDPRCYLYRGMEIALSFWN
ncbi:MAG: DUF2752 domain-containing protein [Kiritimatiellae bacterium]|nr:DUF2752 domain-containing protein [Kiritimatiellia bacterium]